LRPKPDALPLARPRLPKLARAIEHRPALMLAPVGLTSREIGRALTISYRTVAIYRARLTRMYNVANTGELDHKLMAG